MRVVAMNRKDRLEEFIWNNKSELDTPFSGEALWTKIDRDLDDIPEDPNRPKKKRGYKNIYIALGILALLAITASIFYELGERRSEEKMMLFAEVDEMELHFERQTLQLVKTVGNNHNILQNPDLEEVDDFIEEIKSDLEKMPEGSEEKALHALMESYRTKLIIIENIINSYENTQSKDNNEYNI